MLAGEIIFTTCILYPLSYYATGASGANEENPDPKQWVISKFLIVS